MTAKTLPPSHLAACSKAVSGGLTNIPNTTFRIEVFTMPLGGGPQALLGFINVTTDATGSVRFILPVPTLALGNVVTATATNLTSGDTSESAPVGTQLLVFSNPIIASSNVPQIVTLSAQLFAGSKPVTTGQVMFSILGLPGQVTATPNANGVATVNFTLPAGVTPGPVHRYRDFWGRRRDCRRIPVRVWSRSCTPVIKVARLNGAR